MSGIEPGRRDEPSRLSYARRAQREQGWWWWILVAGIVALGFGTMLAPYLLLLFKR